MEQLVVVSSKEISEHFGVDKQVAWRLLSFLQEIGVANLEKEEKGAKGGRPIKFYEVPAKIHFDLSELA